MSECESEVGMWSARPEARGGVTNLGGARWSGLRAREWGWKLWEVLCMHVHPLSVLDSERS